MTTAEHTDLLPAMYMEFVRNLTKPGSAILADMTAEKANLAHLAMGCVGEAGELVDVIKKHVIYGQDLNREHAIEELGDLAFFVHALYMALGVTPQQVLEANVAKLSRRYPSMNFSDFHAKARLDKGDESES